MKRSKPLRRSWKRSYGPPKDQEHEAAAELARNSLCLLCGRIGSCVPAHFPRHRGSGGRWRHPWHRKHWVPLCSAPHDERRGSCHDWIDGRTGGQINEETCQERERERAELLARKRRLWWTE